MRNVQGLAPIIFALAGCSTTIGGASPNELPEAADAGAQQPDPADAAIQEPESLTLRQGTGTPVANANVNCRYGEQGPHADTRHFRLFPAASIGGSRITEALLPIEVADSPEGTQPATLKLHRLTGDILNGEFTLLSETPFNVPDQTLGEVRVALDLSVPADESIVVEVSMGDGEQLRNLRFGYNLQAQMAPTYYASDTCGQLNPVDLATLDNPFILGETFAANSWLVSLTIER